MASVTIRYARAFADVVIDQRLDLDAIRRELRAAVELMESSHDLRRVLENPAIPREQKVRLLDAICQRTGFATAVRNFLAVLAENGRIALLGRIAEQVELELNERLGYTDAAITSARELSAEERRSLETEIHRLTGKKPLTRYAVDPSVIGGAVVRLGSVIYDGSVRGQLRRMREQLAEA